MYTRRLEMLSQCVFVDKCSAIAVRADGHGCRDLWHPPADKQLLCAGVKEAMKPARVKQAPTTSESMLECRNKGVKDY